MARKRERVFAGFFAVLFLVTASATTIAVIVTLIQQHDQNASTAAATSEASKLSQEAKTVNPTQQQGDKLANFVPTPSIPTLQTEDITVGSGATVIPGATVTVNYTGAVAATGIIFQTSSQPVTFGLKEVIPGWTQGIPGMKVGGTRRLLIPADLAYGANPPSGSGIPANAPLVFDVTVTKID